MRSLSVRLRLSSKSWPILTVKPMQHLKMTESPYWDASIIFRACFGEH